MNRSKFLLLLGMSVFAIVPPIASQQTNSATPHWTLSDSETLWRGHYSNCDYGFLVLLGPEVVGHDTLPPSPNHGVTVSLPDVGSTSPVTNKEERFIDVSAYYDTTLVGSLAGAAAYEEGLMAGVSDRPLKKKRIYASLAGHRAAFSTISFASAKGNIVIKLITALRAGIIYTISLQTTNANLKADEEQFEKIRNGFQFLPLPQGECSND